MNRNGFWWEKSQKSFSGSRDGWDEREKGSKCLSQIKQPKKNKGKKKWKVMTSIFFLVNFFHFLSIQESKNGSFWQGMAEGRELSVPLLCVPAPCAPAWGRASLTASAGGCLDLLPVGQCQGTWDGEGEWEWGQTPARVPPPSASPAPRHCQQHGVASVPLSPGESCVTQRWLCLSSVNCQLDPGN